MNKTACETWIDFSQIVFYKNFRKYTEVYFYGQMYQFKKERVSEKF